MPEIPPREALTVGSRIWFTSEKRPYTVKAISSDRRWMVCTKPFAARRTSIYTVIDFENEVRGRDDYYGLGYETDEECVDALARFEAGTARHSRRHPPIPLDIDKIEVRFEAVRGGTQ